MANIKAILKSKMTYIALCGILSAAFFIWVGATFKFQTPVTVRFQTPVLWRYPKTPEKPKTPQKKASGVQIKPIVKEVQADEPKEKILPEKKFLTVDADRTRTKGLEYLKRYYKGDELTAMDNLIKRESGWRVDAVNPSSGAGGIPQALPFSKTGCGMTEADMECQLQWMVGYINQRYQGSPIVAYEFQVTNGWY